MVGVDGYALVYHALILRGERALGDIQHCEYGMKEDCEWIDGMTLLGQ